MRGTTYLSAKRGGTATRKMVCATLRLSYAGPIRHGYHLATTFFIEMFCTVKTAVGNPMMNPSGPGGRRAFLVLEEGGLDGSFGY